MIVQLKLLIFVKLLNDNFYFYMSNVQILENNKFNSLLKKMFQFFFMLIMFDLNPVVIIYCMKFFHKNRTLGKKKNLDRPLQEDWYNSLQGLYSNESDVLHSFLPFPVVTNEWVT